MEIQVQLADATSTSTRTSERTHEKESNVQLEDSFVKEEEKEQEQGRVQVVQSVADIDETLPAVTKNLISTQTTPTLQIRPS